MATVTFSREGKGAPEGEKKGSRAGAVHYADERDESASSPRRSELAPRTQPGTPTSLGISMLDDRSNKPRVSTDGRPVPILRTNREFGYGRFRRLSAAVKVRFCCDRNELLFFEKDNEALQFVEPPPSVDLVKCVKAFLLASRKSAIASKHLREEAAQQVDAAKEVHAEIEEATRTLAEDIERQDRKTEEIMQAIQQKRQERVEKFKTEQVRKKLVVVVDDGNAPKSGICCFR